MLVCHCNVVTDGQISAAISAGAHDLAAVAASCAAGRDCLGCAPTIERLLFDAGLALRSPERLESAQAGRRRHGRVGIASVV